MCLAVPHVISEILGEGRAIAAAGAVAAEIRTDLLDSPAPGDVVLVHAGFAIERLSPSESDELLALWDEVRRLAEASRLPEAPQR
ncbi:MAG: HypC/HybG/HupF family hydrogenase formation chaperone [Synergistaceae bacterium]|nr:HypC/HybG/HupF family hydrogenase formation chaperone [Synergistota bacterium]NLM70691.1 HypC/HybG/HupF family hydrogenase formation chaperone [Synergistaceae bacterium]